MKELLTLRNKLWIPLLWLGISAAGHAQSLGTPAATAWIGRPFEMTVPARFASADARDECVQADVFFGDTRLPAHRVRASILGSDPQQKRVRIETDRVVDEPVVTVSIRAGCQNAVTRSYTLLPDLPSEQVLAGLAVQRPWAPVAAAPLSPAMAAAAAMAPIQLAAATSTARPPRATGARAAGPIALARREAAPMPRPVRAAGPVPAVAVARSGPRLRLEPIEADGSPFLRASAQLASPGGDAARRATAALLWQALNADPQEVLRTTVMLHNLERDLARLRDDASRTRGEMAALRQRLDAVQPWQPSIAMLQLLGVLVLASAAAAGLLWYRTRRSADNRWYAQAPPLFAQVPASNEPAPAEVASDAAQPAPDLPECEPVVGGATPALPEMTVGPEASAGSAALPAPGPGAKGPIEFDVPAHASPRQRRGTDGVLRVETLAATFDEVEFLSSLGLTVDAAGVLKSYLQDSASPAPIAFFELIRLCEQEEDSRAADLVRRRYAEVFGVAAPRLEQVIAPLGLECMPVLTGRITASWNTPRVLSVIEEALFGPSAAAPMLTLQAGRDLLCLYDVAMSLVSDAAPSPAGGGHALAPWAHAQDAAGARIAVQAMTDVGDGSVLGVDIDLGTSPAVAAAKQREKQARREPETAMIGPDIAPLAEELHAAARAAEERAALRRRQQEQEDAFSAAVASERMPIARR